MLGSANQDYDGTLVQFSLTPSWLKMSTFSKKGLKHYTGQEGLMKG